MLQLFAAMKGGDPASADALLALLYSDLRRQAAAYFRSRRSGHTLQPTALVHEAFVRVAQSANLVCRNRSHFLALAAKAMRQVLADHFRRRRAAKRGGAWQRVTMMHVGSDGGERQIDALDLEEALTALAELNPLQAQVVELRFYGGLSIEEISQTLEISPRKTELEWRMSRAWLRDRLGGAEFSR